MPFLGLATVKRGLEIMNEKNTILFNSFIFHNLLSKNEANIRFQSQSAITLRTLYMFPNLNFVFKKGSIVCHNLGSLKSIFREISHSPRKTY